MSVIYEISTPTLVYISLETLGIKNVLTSDYL